MTLKLLAQFFGRNRHLIGALVLSVLTHTLAVGSFGSGISILAPGHPSPFIAEIRKASIAKKTLPITLAPTAVTTKNLQTKHTLAVAPTITTQTKTSDSPTIAALSASPITGVPSFSAAAPVGETVYTPPTFSAAYLANPPPPYPLSARRRGIEGTVRIDVLVSREGAARDTKLKLGSGAAELDNSAIGAVNAWRFVPARRGNEPVEAWVTVPIRFQLKSASEKI